MSHEDDDRRLTDLLSDAVSDVEPPDRLQAIRSRTRGASMTTRRPWWYAVGGVAAATAAVIIAFAVIGGPTDEGQDPQPAASDSASASDSPTESASEDPAPEQVAAPIYYAGETPQGLRLYREFQRVPAGERLLAAARAATEGTPLDPDYASLWGAPAVTQVSFDGTGAQGEFAVTLRDESLTSAPAGMTGAEAELAVQQLVYTLQGVGQARAPVRFYVGGEPVDTVLGLDAAEPFTNAPQLDVLALVNITSPEEGATVSAGTLDISGVASSFEATVPVAILDSTGDVVLEDFVTAEGCCDRLYPWEGSLDISGLPSGDYTFRASTDDPSDGEGDGPQVDTKTITIP
jgi:hypothetical protein